MTLEQVILEILKLVGLPGLLVLVVAVVLLMRSRANVMEASAQASIARDNAEVVRSLAQKREDENALLFKHILESKQQIIELTSMIGAVRLELTEKINAVQVENAALRTEAGVRRESEQFLRDEVIGHLMMLMKDVKVLVDGQSNGISGSVQSDTGTKGSSLRKDSQPEVDNIERTDEGSTEVSPISGGDPTGQHDMDVPDTSGSDNSLAAVSKLP